jgi:hypothetical protein
MQKKLNKETKKRVLMIIIKKRLNKTVIKIQSQIMVRVALEIRVLILKNILDIIHHRSHLQEIKNMIMNKVKQKTLSKLYIMKKIMI